LIKKAVIVAAGLATRLHPLTLSRPKPLLSVDGESLLVRSVRLLRESGVAEIGVVVGYRADMIAEAVESHVTCIANPFYRHCNNMGSLWMARHFVGATPFIYLHGDLIYSEKLLADFVAVTGASTASVDLLTSLGPVDDEAMKVRTRDDGRLIESSKRIGASDADGEWIGIAAVHRPRDLFATLERHLLNHGLLDYDTAAFTAMAAAGEEVKCLPSGEEPWVEIDTAEDLELARSQFARV